MMRDPEVHGMPERRVHPEDFPYEKGFAFARHSSGKIILLAEVGSCTYVTPQLLKLYIGRLPLSVSKDMAKLVH